MFLLLILIPCTCQFHLSCNRYVPSSPNILNIDQKSRYEHYEYNLWCSDVCRKGTRKPEQSASPVIQPDEPTLFVLGLLGLCLGDYDKVCSPGWISVLQEIGPSQTCGKFVINNFVIDRYSNPDITSYCNIFSVYSVQESYTTHNYTLICSTVFHSIFSTDKHRLTIGDKRNLKLRCSP